MKKIHILLLTCLVFKIGYAQENKTGSSTNVQLMGYESLDLDTAEAKQLILEKTLYLEKYISLLTSNRKTDSEAREITELALKLFVSDTSKVEVSSIKDGNVRVNVYTIKVYLSKLKNLRNQYDEIRIKWYNVAFITDLRRGPDGRYYGTVSIVQKFEGMKDGIVLYRDETTKHIEVVLDAYKVGEDGKENIRLEIFLSRIGVEETISI